MQQKSFLQIGYEFNGNRSLGIELLERTPVEKRKGFPDIGLFQFELLREDELNAFLCALGDRQGLLQLLGCC